ncbi:hypothetical protein [Pelagibacterium montanilacus]|uniref:hypothetical protein n=1 Tax=Pelagibacterium montanilacus TaxID=2185280 RepID=UPI000F8EA09D|nr:hypothetical protein [Pelagibacterium montanilacus]
MDLRAEPADKGARLLSLASLLLGLGDAMSLLGVSTGGASPVTALGASGFAMLAVLCIARLFAAVGLWIQSVWGAVIFGGSLLAEVVLFVAAPSLVGTSLIGFIFKVALLLATIALLLFARRASVRRAGD